MNGFAPYSQGRPILSSAFHQENSRWVWHNKHPAFAGTRATSVPAVDELLLLGDGSYDPKNRIPGNNNLVPTFQSVESLSSTASYVTDDYFGIMADNSGQEANGSIDIGIGRFPVSTASEAK